MTEHRTSESMAWQGSDNAVAFSDWEVKHTWCQRLWSASWWRPTYTKHVKSLCRTCFIKCFRLKTHCWIYQSTPLLLSSTLVNCAARIVTKLPTFLNFFYLHARNAVLASHRWQDYLQDLPHWKILDSYFRRQTTSEKYVLRFCFKAV